VKTKTIDPDEGEGSVLFLKKKGGGDRKGKTAKSKTSPPKERKIVQMGPTPGKRAIPLQEKELGGPLSICPTTRGGEKNPVKKNEVGPAKETGKKRHNRTRSQKGGGKTSRPHHFGRAGLRNCPGKRRGRTHLHHGRRGRKREPYFSLPKKNRKKS